MSRQLVLLIALSFACGSLCAAPGSLRFFGNGSNDQDRIKIRIDNPADGNPGPPADIGGTDFTIEFWIKAAASDNTAAAVGCGSNISWINGNIILDRDRFNQDRKFGISVAGGLIVFGVSGDGTGDRTICGTTNVLDSQWHHIALQRRRSDGRMWLYVDGVEEAAEDGPDGDVSYPNNGVPGNYCGGPCDDSDPFLVIGAEKHDAGSAYPSFSGWLDELRLSSTLRYSGDFRPPGVRFMPDPDTAALYHFDEGMGDDITDSSGPFAALNLGQRKFGGSPIAGPVWSTEAPLLTSPRWFQLRLFMSGLNRPVGLTHANDNSGRLFVIEQGGLIRIIKHGQLLSTPFLDVSSLISGGSGGERGLLGLTFHPGYASNGLFYIYYTNSSGDSILSRYAVSGGDADVAGSTASILLTIPQPGSNHNGGGLHFGADGYLYIGSGDGGGSGSNSGGDFYCNGQNLTTTSSGGEHPLLGKLLRIDVDSGFPYSIPAGNPYDNEIWAYGLRNPWRFSPDRATGDVFIGDVGQNEREEISFQPRNAAGGINYGWNREEGNSCYNGSNNPSVNALCGKHGIPACGDPSFIRPLFDVSSGSGSDHCSITGGYRYRGNMSTDLFGTYIFGDFCSGRIWFASQNPAGAWTSHEWTDTGLLISSFGEDQAGEIYLVNLNGDIYKFTGYFFDDVPPADPDFDNIEGAVHSGVSGGCGANSFCQRDAVKRSQLASYLIRAKYGSSFRPASATGGVFDDVAATHPEAGEIEKLMGDGITEGCSTTPALFCPDAVVTHGQLALLLTRATGATPVGATNLFDDVPVSHPLIDFIEHAYNMGYLDACADSPLRFCPADAAAKHKVVTAVSRAFNL